MQKLRYICWLMLLQGLWGGVAAQDSLAWHIRKVVAEPQVSKSQQRRLRQDLGDAKSAADLRVRSAETGLWMDARGYQAFAIDTFEVQGKVLKLSVYPGQRYFYDSIALPGLNESTFQKAGFERMQKRHEVFSWRDFKSKLAFCLDAYQNKGYPFASFEDMQMEYRQTGADSVGATIRYQFEPGKMVTIDSVIIEGKVRERPSFIQNLVGIYAGDQFDQSAIDRARRLLNSSPYYKNAKPAKVVFISEDKAQVTLNLEPRKSGKFDVLIGILPPDNNTAKLQITGLIDLQLVSPLFKAGEVIELRIDKLPGSSQKLHMRYAMPYLFSSPMGIDANFDLLKQDTTFLTRSFKLAAPYAFSPSLSLRAFLKTKSSTLISTQRYQADTTAKLPVLDGKDQTYGIGFSFENLDDRFSPTKGWRIKVDGGLGSKKVVKNPRLAESFYRGVERSLPKKETELRLEFYQKYTKRMVLALANSTYWLDQKQYFRNDELPIGGSRSIRGFNENQFFASFYTALTIENRFLLEERSYLFVFSDIAYLEDKAATLTPKVLHPWGIGLGLTYETKAGIISLTYAAGQVENAPFAPSRGKIHIGLVNQF